MNVMLQRHCAKHIYIVPEGLRELMTDISREVLRHQPENTYVFIADYLEALMITRENARVASKLVQEITDISRNTCQFLLDTGVAKDDVHKIITIMQHTFKKSLRDPKCLETVMPEEIEEANIISQIINEADVDVSKGEEAAKIIQKAYRNFKMRKEREQELLCGVIDWRVAARSAIRLYKKTGVTNEEVNRAATLIKAAYKGYYTRCIMKKLLNNQTKIEKMQQLLSFLDDSIARLHFEETGESERSEKEVTINYDTTVPHVLFGDSETINDLESASSPSTPNAVADHAMKLIVESTFKAVGLDEFSISEIPPPVPLRKESARRISKEELEEIFAPRLSKSARKISKFAPKMSKTEVRESLEPEVSADEVPAADAEAPPAEPGGKTEIKQELEQNEEAPAE